MPVRIKEHLSSLQMLHPRILLVLTGDAFRHVNGRPYVDPANFNDQKTCSFSHLRFLQRLAPVEADVFINTYQFTAEYDQALKSWYPNLIRYTAHPEFLGEYNLIDNTIDQLHEIDLTGYVGVLFVRIDLFLREYFNFVFREHEDSVLYAYLDSNEISGGKGPYPGICHNVTYVPSSFFPLLLQGVVWKRHVSANLLVKYTNKIKFYSNTFHSSNTADEWNPLFAMAGRDEPQVLWCGPSGNRRGKRFNSTTMKTATIPNDFRFDYLLDRDTRVKWKSNPEALVVPKKRVVIYANCQGDAIQGILAYHSDLSDEYDLFGARVLNNYVYMNTNAGLPYDILGEADLFIYQPISTDRGKYSSIELLKTLKPGCKTVSFPYIYNYAFWEVLAMSDADYDIGPFGMKYAHLNQRAITDLRDAGVPFEEVERRIRSGTMDWKFAERWTTTQTILREKEKECDVKVADFVEANYRDHLLFYTQNHPSMFFLRYVAEEIIKTLGYNPSILPDETHLIQPDYNSGHQVVSPYGYEMGVAAWQYFGFRFIAKPRPHVTETIVAMSRLIYNGEGIEPRCVSTS